MGFMNVFTGLLSLSQKPVIETPTRQAFTLEVWLDNSPLNHQAVSWYPTSTDAGFFGIEIRSPSEPLPSEDRAIFVRDSSFPESLFFLSSTKTSESKGSEADVVFVQQWGEIQYASEVPGEGGPIQELPFTGNFSTVDFTYWPDRKTYEALEFEPPGFVQGVFLACPGTVGGKKGYLLYAMTPTFQRGGCITLDWLVYKDLDGNAVLVLGRHRAMARRIAKETSLSLRDFEGGLIVGPSRS